MKRPRDLQASRVDLGGDEYVVLSFPVPALDIARLTPAEVEVARAIAAGKSNADIAAARGRSVRTVANQVAQIFRKLGVGSRLELARRLGG